MNAQIRSLVYRRVGQDFDFGVSWSSVTPGCAPIFNGSAAAQSNFYRLARQGGQEMACKAPQTQQPKEHVMPRIYLYFLIFTVLSPNLIPSALAQESADHKTPATNVAAPTPGFRAEFLEEVAYYEQRYTRLAEAMPA
jgi:hypothetical protein